MVDRFPLLDGTEIDLDYRIDSHPQATHDRAIVLRNDYAEESLDWWETYNTDNGPASATFNGLATSGGMTEIELDTGSTNSNDITEIQGPTVNWDNWTEIRAYVWGAKGNNLGTDGDRHFLHLSDNGDPGSVSNGFFVGQATGQVAGRVVDGGTQHNSYANPNVTGSEEISYGFRIYENQHGTGHTIDFILNGQTEEGWSENRGWPGATDLTFRNAVRTGDGNTVKRSIDGWLIELIP